jgi:hypothetical protein
LSKLGAFMEAHYYHLKDESSPLLGAMLKTIKAFHGA